MGTVLIGNTGNGTEVSYLTAASAAQTSNSVINFNGNDAVALLDANNTVLDAFGQGINAKDASYVRNQSVTKPSPAFVAAEWTLTDLNVVQNAEDLDDANRLGAHVAPDLPDCVSPLNQATALAFSGVGTKTISLNFTRSDAGEYLIIRSLNSSLSAAPVDGTVYNAGSSLGGGTVAGRTVGNTFTDSNLPSGTNFYYFIYALNSTACDGGPKYLLVNPLSGSQATNPLPVCQTPLAQATNFNISFSNYNSVQGSFTPAAGADEFMMLMSTDSTLSALPLNQTSYAIGDTIGNAIVIRKGAQGNFSRSGLQQNTEYFFYVFAVNSNCSGGPLYLTRAPLTGRKRTSEFNANALNFYFGNLHAHSSYSDGNKDDTSKKPEDDYAFAKNSMNMDFLGLSEHNHTQAGMRLANWQPGRIAAQNANAPDFVALHGMEWGVISGGGHVLVYGVDSLIGWEPGEHQIYVPKNTYTGTTGLFNAINRHGLNAIATLAHPNTSDYNNISGTYNALADSAIVGTALASGPAFSTNLTYSDPASSMSYLSYYNRMLAQGYRLGASIDHDNHNMTFGRHTRARLVVLAPSLTENDLLDGMKKMRFYASEDSAAKITYSINDQPVGSVFSGRGMPKITVSGATTSPITSISIMSGRPGTGINPTALVTSSSPVLSYSDSTLTHLATGYYYADIREADGSRIITSPIWYTRNDSIKVEQMITFNPLPAKAYGDPDFAPAATSSNTTIPVTYTSSDTTIASIVDGKVHILGAGTVTITAAQAGNSQYKAAVSKTQQLLIAPKAIAVSIQPKAKEYGAPDPALTYTSSPALVGTDVFTGSLTRAAGENAGTYAITKGTLALSGNYTLTADSSALVISKKAVLAKADPKEKVYGAPDPALTYTYSPELAGGDSFTGSLSRAAGENAGTYGIGAGTLALNTNYVLTVDSALLTITKKDLTITADNKTRPFNSPNPLFTATYNGFVNEEGAAVLTTAPEFASPATQTSPVGSYPITVSGAAAANYLISYLPGTLSVELAGQTISFTALPAKTYGDADFNLTATGGGSDNPVTYTSSNTGVATISGNTVHIVSAGSTRITASQAGTPNYTAASDVMQVLTVNKAAATLSLSNLSQANDGTEKVVTVTTNPVGLTGVSITYNGTSSPPLLVGSYTVNAVLDNPNYSAVPVTGTLTLTQQQALKVQYRNGDKSLTDKEGRPELKLLNNGTAALAYSQLTARYWITPENFTGSLGIWIDHAQLGKNNVTLKYVPLSIPRVNALGYIEYGFTASAGSLAAGTNSGDIQSRFANSDGSTFNEANDYSIGTNSAYADKTTITLYRNGVLIWGTEPTAEAPLAKLKVYYEGKGNGNSKTISTTLDIRNEGNVPLDFGDVTARYWFTSEGTSPLNFSLDHAKKGSNSVSGAFTVLNPARTNADVYLELKLSPGTFYPLNSTGDIEYRINKNDWSAFTQTNDYSFRTGSMAENPKITLYHKGQLIYGTEPNALSAPVYMSTEAPEKVSFTPANAESASTIVYPNPSYGSFTLTLGDDRSGPFTATIYNSAGKPLDTYSGNKTGSFSKQYQLQLSKGMYYMIINWKNHKDYKTILIN